MTEEVKKPTTAEEQFLAKLERYVTEGSSRNSFKGMFYGAAGTGKTTIAMQLASKITKEDETVCYIDSDQNWSFINPEHKLNAFRMGLGGIDPIPSIARAVYEKLGRFAKVGTIVVDEFSSFANMDLVNLTEERAAKQNGKEAFEPKLPDMNASSNRMLKVSGSLIALEGVNVILCSHERYDLDYEGSSVSHIGPLLMPKFSARLEGLLHLVGHVSAEDKSDKEGKVVYNRNIQIFPTKKVIAKSKIGGLDKVVVKPNELVDSINNWLNPKEEEAKTEETEKTNNKLLEQLEEAGN